MLNFLRPLIFMAFAPLVLYYISRRIGCLNWKFFIGLILAIFLSYFVINFFLFYDHGQLNAEATLNGRYDLWVYYWNKFIYAPFFGNGVFLLDRVKDYRGYATSEIGLLKTAAEYGVFAMSVKLFLVFTAVLFAFKTLFNKSADSHNLVFALYLLPAFPVFLLESYTRYSGVNDYFFWYATFFFCYQATPFFRRSIVI